MALSLLDEIIGRLDSLPVEERTEIVNAAMQSTSDMIWIPQPGPQTEAYFCEADELFFGGQAGGGKLFRNTEPIPTPSGWKTMGELVIGDKIFDETGNACNVVFISPTNPNPDMYRIKFDDGTEIDACSEHRWYTYNAKELADILCKTPEWREKRRNNRPSRVSGNRSDTFSRELAARNSSRDYQYQQASGGIRTTKEISETLFVGKNRRKNHAIQVSECLNLPDMDLPLHPYVLGAWLGDGTAASGGITGIDKEIFDYIEGLGYEVSHSTSCNKSHHIIGIMSALRSLGVVKNKHIPLAYLRASYNQRLELLRGLMDTDGTVSDSGAAEFCNTNRNIIDGIYELIVSLGWKASIREGDAKLYGRFISKKWTIKWTPSEYVFMLPRKKQKQRIATRRTTRFRYIVSCESVYSSPGRCIQVDSPNRLYLAGRSMIPTHNTDLGIGLALTDHHDSLLLRRTSKDADALFFPRIEQIIGNTEGRNMGSASKWEVGDRTMDIGGCQREDDKQKFKGKPHDYIFFDELPDFTRSQFEFIKTWNRSAMPGQRCRIIGAGNPPTTAEGLWVIEYWAPWLDPKHPNPAKSGEIRHFVVDRNNRSIEVPRKGRYKLCHNINDGLPTVSEVEENTIITEDDNVEILRSRSRCFIRSRLSDNAYLANTDYAANLDALPAEIRAAYRDGHFYSSIKDNPWQIIPTQWILAAQERWKPTPPKDVPMCSMGVDVAQGGEDTTVIYSRYDWWYSEPIKVPGKKTPLGSDVAGLIIGKRRNGAIPVVDMGGGYGGGVIQTLGENNIKFYAYKGSEGATARTKDGKLKFKNKRAQAYWQFREALDPDQPGGSQIALPPIPIIVADLTAPTFKVSGTDIVITSKEDVCTALGRSPDDGDAIVMAWFQGAKLVNIEDGNWKKFGKESTPKVVMGHQSQRRRK
jgi:hypothetical protein